ncbi:MAG: SURF1 family protein [Pseudomonadota bacterium]
MVGSLQFDFEWRITLFTLLLLPALVSLGFWQLQRADEKTAIAAAFEERSRRAPVDVAAMTPEQAALPYLPVQVRGRVDNERSFLLDNKLRAGRFGYEVLSPVQLEGSGGWVIVNRGWLAGDPARLSLPEIPSLTGVVNLSGQLYIAPGEAYLLAEQALEPGWPKRLQAMDAALIGEALGTSLALPHPVRIDAGQTGALAADWQIINVSPEKHTGYAVQWFSMAAALAVAYLLRSTNLWQLLRGRPHEEPES